MMFAAQIFLTVSDLLFIALLCSVLFCEQVLPYFLHTIAAVLEKNESIFFISQLWDPLLARNNFNTNLYESATMCVQFASWAL